MKGAKFHQSKRIHEMNQASPAGSQLITEAHTSNNNIRTSLPANYE